MNTYVGEHSPMPTWLNDSISISVIAQCACALTDTQMRQHSYLLVPVQKNNTIQIKH